MSSIKSPFINLKRYVETENCARVGVEGRYTIRAIKPGHGVVRELSFPNLLTNLGMNALGSAPSFLRMHLGTGTAAPDVTDTGLGAFGVNVTTSTPSTTDRGAQSIAPYYGWQRLTFTSAVGAATGTWTEIGISNQTTNGNLRSRALILDGDGNPTSFPVLSDEQFQGVYEIRFYPPTSDDMRAITLSGVPYDATTRALDVTNGSALDGSWAPNVVPANSPFSTRTGNLGGLYTGGLGAITDSLPQGSQIPGSSSGANAAYGSGNFYLDVSRRWGSASGVGTIRTVRFISICTSFQIEYDPTFAKLTTEEFIHNQRISWARR